MKPARAARQFIRVVTSYRDFLDLVEPMDGEEKIKTAFKKVERSVWRVERIKPQDMLKLSDAVENCVPKKHRKAVRKALNDLSVAETNYLLVREQTAYLVGLEMGRRLRRD
jgi:hypothetical protein